MKHTSWRLSVPGYSPFSMGGEACTESEARHAAALIWPDKEIELCPGSAFSPAAAGQSTAPAASAANCLSSASASGAGHIARSRIDGETGK